MNKSEILEGIRKKVGRENLFCGNVFKKGNCSVDLTGFSENDRVVVDLDKVYTHGQHQQNQCECILFFFDDIGNFIVVPIELKGGKNAESAKAVKQLKGGAGFAIGYTPKKYKNICRPVLFHNSISRSEVTQLKKDMSKVLFCGNSYEIKTARCGSKLADVLPNPNP